MAIQRPESVATPATLEDFRLQKIDGSHAYGIEFCVTFPDAGYLVMTFQHGLMGEHKINMRRARFYPNGKQPFEVEHGEPLNPDQVKLSDDGKTMEFGDVTVEMSDLKEGFKMRGKNEQRDMELRFIPEADPVRMGSGRTEDGEGHFQRRAYMPRCKVEGNIELKGHKIPLDGAVGDVMCGFSNDKPNAMTSDLRLIRCHSKRISILSLELAVQPKHGGGFACETFVLLDGKLVEASTAPLSEGIADKKVKYGKADVHYRTDHQIKLAKTQFETTTSEATLVGANNIMEKMPAEFRDQMMGQVGQPWGFEFYRGNTPVTVDGVTDHASATIFNVTMV